MKIITDTIPLSPILQHRIAKLYETDGRCGLCPQQIRGNQDRFIMLQPHANNQKQIELTALVTCMKCAQRVEQTMSLCRVILDPSTNGAGG